MRRVKIFFLTFFGLAVGCAATIAFGNYVLLPVMNWVRDTTGSVGMGAMVAFVFVSFCVACLMALVAD